MFKHYTWLFVVPWTTFDEEIKASLPFLFQLMIAKHLKAGTFCLELYVLMSEQRGFSTPGWGWNMRHVVSYYYLNTTREHYVIVSKKKRHQNIYFDLYERSQLRYFDIITPQQGENSKMSPTRQVMCSVLTSSYCLKSKNIFHSCSPKNQTKKTLLLFKTLNTLKYQP
jgi:hypothetical protein